MIEKIIDEILLVEEEAEQLIAKAKEEADQILSQNAKQIDKLYADAEEQLKSEVKTIILAAEEKANESERIEMQEAIERINILLEKAKSKFDGAVERVISVLKGE